MRTTDVIVIGAGQAGLAVSHCLGLRGIDHVVLDRGRVAERWRSERWDSLRLLTPNWQTRLPGFAYDGGDRDGFMTMPEVVAFFERYAAESSAPVMAHTRVLRVDAHPAGYRVRTDRGDLLAPNVVVATGYCDRPFRPAVSRALSPRVHQLAPAAYRNPAALPPGGVLVVGASASGAQLADELQRSGRNVVLAVGRHTRLPRRYRGADIMTWLDRIGSLTETVDDVADLAASLRQPSLQLMGSPEARALDLVTLQRIGVRLCGHLRGVAGTQVSFDDDLEQTARSADAKLSRLLDRIDRHAVLAYGGSRAHPRPAPLRVGRSPRAIDLAAEGISTVIWATGYRRDYGFLNVRVLDARGEIRQLRGVTEAAGLYTMGQRFQWTRKSSFIDGVAADAEYVARHIAGRLGMRESDAA